jgi:hypothetical protein
MALIQNVPIMNGKINASYWKITVVTVDRSKLCLNVSMSLFLEKDASDITCSQFLRKDYFFSSDKTSLSGDVTALAYVNIKAYSSTMIASGNNPDGSAIMVMRDPVIGTAQDG